MAADVARVIALGASNLTRGFRTVVSAARAAWGPEVQVLAALGHGRSYGAPSRVVFRTLPGILESGLWRTLESLPALPTRALVADVGNDILYGLSAERILAWVEEALSRLQRVTLGHHPHGSSTCQYPPAVPSEVPGVSLDPVSILSPVVGPSAGDCRARERRPRGAVDRPRHQVVPSESGVVRT